ncbi:MAG: hypothetical protein AAGA48_18975 [Myxococcota bacterium]
MPGPPIPLSSQVLCPHGAPAAPVPAPSPTALVYGTPILTVASQHLVSTCPLSAVGAPPCATVLHQTSVRVLVRGIPAVLAPPGGSTSLQPTAAPNGPSVVVGAPFTIVMS